LEGFPEQYRFTFISKGAYGKVYKGINPLTQELFALKIIDFADERCQGIPA
jgi:serine/threonine protein kinase